MIRPPAISGAARQSAAARRVTSGTIVSAALVTVILLATAPRTSAAPGEGDSAAAREYLNEAVRNPRRAETALMALQSTGDSDLTVVFVAAAGSGRKELRLLGAVALSDFSGGEASRALLERVEKDPAMAVRAEALNTLISLDAIDNEQLLAALDVPDEAVRCIAARQLVRRKRSAPAAEALLELAGSKDPATAAVARLSLLAAGNADQLQALEKLFNDPATDDSVLAVALTHIAEDKLAAAAGLAAGAANSNRPHALRLLAYRAFAAASAEARVAISDQIGRTENISYAVGLLHVLAGQEAAEAHLERLASGGGVIAVLSRFELARGAGGPDARAAAERVAALGHPVVMEYLLDRAATDVGAGSEKSSFYVPALLLCIRSAEADSPRMAAEHIRAARAATLLADLGTEEAMAALEAILGERFNCRVRAAAAGLLRTKNRAACGLAAGFLDSPYRELATDAALTLGRFGDPAAAKYLAEIVRRPSRHSPALVTLASWYLLKIDGSAALAARELAAAIE